MDKDRNPANKPSDMGINLSDALASMNPSLRSAMGAAMRNMDPSHFAKKSDADSMKAPSPVPSMPKQSLEVESEQLSRQATTLKSQSMQETTERVAKRLSEKAHSKNVQDAANDPYSRVSMWMLFLPITRRQMIVLGRVYSFMCTKRADGTPGEYRMSMAHGSQELGFGQQQVKTGRRDLKADLKSLVDEGYLTKRSNGTCKPATYLVNIDFCLEKAREAGWKPKSEEGDEQSTN